MAMWQVWVVFSVLYLDYLDESRNSSNQTANLRSNDIPPGPQPSSRVIPQDVTSPEFSMQPL